MKLTRRVTVLVMIFCFMLSFATYASELSWETVPGNHGESILLSEEYLSSKDEYRILTRGDFLSAGITEILNGQNGTIGINIDTYAHFGVDRMFHTVFLDQWDEVDEDWSQVGSWNFVKTKEETADGDLHAFTTSLTLSGYETGKYYRVRGLHGAEYNDEVEATATETDGVLITDGPT